MTDPLESPVYRLDIAMAPIPIITLIMRIGKGRVTAAEVAKKAGVSQPTVSLVLTRNPKARVAPETRARILKIAEELGYRPNRLAQGLVHRRSFALGIIVPGLGNPVYVNIISGAERVAADAGYAVLLCETGHVDVMQHLEALRDRQIDGVVVAGVAASTLPPGALDQLNVVLVNQPSARYPTVGGDSLKAGALAAEHLFSFGHRQRSGAAPALRRTDSARAGQNPAYGSMRAIEELSNLMERLTLPPALPPE